MSRSKIIVLDERVSRTGEPTVQPVLLWANGRACRETLSKEASASPALDYIKAIEPIPGRTIVLILGLGGFEYYGLNRNGDGFPEQPYKMGMKPTCGCCGHGRDAWILQDECIQYHFKSYEHGHVYRHHVNKDPKKAVGKVLKAFWNSFMHRVEVLEDIENDKAPDLVERITDGEFPAKSMGCRIKFDVCTKCGHMSPTRAQYCDHCKFELGVLDPHTGLRNGTLNPAPKFFDSSWVLRPADRTGYLLKKVAEHAYEVQPSSELGEMVDDLNAKAAAARKLAVIDKIVRGYPAAVVQSELPEGRLIEQYRKEMLPAVVQNTAELNAADTRKLAEHDLPHTLAALSHAGIILTTPEFIRLFVEKAIPGAQVPEHVLDNLVALQSEVYDLLGQHPSLLNELLGVLTPEGEAPSSLQSTIAPMIEKRSMMSDYLRRRLVPSSFRMGEEPRTDIMEVQDPTTGRMFQTTRGAVFSAEDELGKAQLKQLLGGAGMLGGAYKVLTSASPKLRLAALPLGLGGLHFGSKAFGNVPMYTTTSGEQVPYLTEFTEKQSNVLDIVNALGLDYRVTKTGSARLPQHMQRHSPMYPFMRKLGSFGLYNNETSLEGLVRGQGKVASDGIREETINLSQVASTLGTLAFELPGI